MIMTVVYDYRNDIGRPEKSGRDKWSSRLRNQPDRIRLTAITSWGALRKRSALHFSAGGAQNFPNRKHV